MKRFKGSLYGLAALSLAVGLAACSSEPGDDNNGGGTDGGNGGDNGGGEAAEGGDFVMVAQGHISGLDPHQVNDVPSGQIQEQIYEGLVKFDEELNIVESLAEDFEADGNRLWFKLREDVTFHDGEAFNAEAVKANIERIIDPDINSQRAFLFEDISEINVIGDYEIEFLTEEVYAPLIFSFAHGGGFMISPAVIAEDYEAMEGGAEPYTVVNEKPMGTGYFKYQSGVAGSGDIVMERNEDYWGDNALLDTVTFKVVPDLSTRVAEIERGDAHLALGVDSTAIPQIDAMPDGELLQTEGISASYYGFNTTVEPFDNPDVRRAIAMAIDNESILNNIMDGYGRAAQGPIPPSVFGYDDSLETIPYDPEAARELLADAGVEDLSVEIRTNDSDTRVRMANYMIAALEDIGVSATINASDFPTYLEDTANGNHEMYILGWSSATADADYALAPLFHSESSAASGNRSFYSNEEVDSLLEAAVVEADENTRLQMYSDAQQIIMDEAPMVFTTYTDYLKAVRSEVEGLVITASDGIELQGVSIQ